jgi:Na+/melibiose symporter-like transporter
MKTERQHPYVASGKAASEQLTDRAMSGAAPDRVVQEVHECRQSLRGFKQVINVFAVAAIAFTPIVGIMTRDAVLAAAVACSFLLIIWMLEMLECGVKRRLAKAVQQRETRSPKPQAPKPATEEHF